MHPSRIEMARPWNAMRAVSRNPDHSSPECSLSASPSRQISP